MNAKIRRVFLSLGLVSAAASAQSMSYGPLYAEGRNAQDLPIFMLICRCRHCTGLRGKSVGSPKDVSRYMPAIPTEIIVRFGYRCLDLCRDPQGNIVGKPSRLPQSVRKALK